MKNILTKFALLLTILISYNCGSDDSAEPEPAPNPNPNKTTTYIADVKTIIDTQCLECHSNPPDRGAPMSLETYAEIIDAVTNQGRVDLSVRMNTTGRNVMPPSGKLSQEIVDIILDWEADGRLEK